MELALGVAVCDREGEVAWYAGGTSTGTLWRGVAGKLLRSAGSMYASVAYAACSCVVRRAAASCPGKLVVEYAESGVFWREGASVAKGFRKSGRCIGWRVFAVLGPEIGASGGSWGSCGVPWREPYVHCRDGGAGTLCGGRGKRSERALPTVDPEKRERRGLAGLPIAPYPAGRSPRMLRIAAPGGGGLPFATKSRFWTVRVLWMLLLEWIEAGLAGLLGPNEEPSSRLSRPVVEEREEIEGLRLPRRSLGVMSGTRRGTSDIMQRYMVYTVTGDKQVSVT